jgi:hypothetical protein
LLALSRWDRVGGESSSTNIASDEREKGARKIRVPLPPHLLDKEIWAVHNRRLTLLSIYHQKALLLLKTPLAENRNVSFAKFRSDL